jgi:hypothetical protein
MLTELPYRSLNGPVGRRGYSMSRLARCLRPQGEAEQYGCIFEVSPDLVWIFIVEYVNWLKMFGWLVMNTPLT